MSGRLIDYDELVPFRPTPLKRLEILLDHDFVAGSGNHCSKCGCRLNQTTASYPCGVKPSRKRVWFWSEGDDDDDEFEVDYALPARPRRDVTVHIGKVTHRNAPLPFAGDDD